MMINTQLIEPRREHKERLNSLCSFFTQFSHHLCEVLHNVNRICGILVFVLQTISIGLNRQPRLRLQIRKTKRWNIINIPARTNYMACESNPKFQA